MNTRALLTTSLAAIPLICASNSPGQQASRTLSPESTAGEPRSSRPAIAANYGNLPLSFETNMGQSDPQVKFVSRGNGYSLFLTDTSAVLTLSHGTERTGMIAPASRNRHGELPGKNATSSAHQDVLRMEMVGAARGVSVQGAQILPGIVNYFIGNDPAKWHTGVPTYARIKYAQVYPGVDLVYYGNQQQLEYDFVIAPHADNRQVRLRFAGVNRVLLSANGDLKLIGNHGEMAFRKPVVYQLLDGKRTPVDGSFKLMAKNEVGFALGRYDSGRELVIDPTLSYSTYLGGEGTYAGDYGNAIAVDSEGNAYITGSTGSTKFPVSSTTPPAFQPHLAIDARNGVSTQNAFVTKINATGTLIVYSTYLGGTGSYWFGDSANAIAVDSAGEAYVTGATGSSDFPNTSGAYQTTNNALAKSGGQTAFVTKLNATGSGLIFSTYLGGTGLSSCCGPPSGDVARGIALDSSGNAYIVGTTYSSDFPTSSSAFQRDNNAKPINESNAFVTKLNSSGSAFEYSTYLGGQGQDAASGVAADGDGSAYVVGTASSTNFPVSNDAYQKTNKSTSTYRPTNLFVSKLNANGSGLVYSTYLGGSGVEFLGDIGSAIAVDPECSAYVTGQTGSMDFPTTAGSLEPKDQGQIYSFSAFVTKLNMTGSAPLVYSTYLGGGSTLPSGEGDSGFGIQVDASGQAYVTGSSQSTNIPVTANAFQNTNKQTRASGNAFLTELNEAGSGVVYSSYLGGSGTDGKGDAASAVALDAAGNAYITGSTYSQDFPVTSGAYQQKSAGTVNQNGITANAIVAKFGIGSGEVLSATTVSITPDANPAAADEKITFTAYVAQGTTCGFPPSGTVSFTIDGGTPIKVTVDDTGHAAYSTTTLTVGKHTISASYSGDMKYKASTSATLTETVTGAPTSLAYVSGTSQTAVYGSAFAKPLVVIVKDAGNGASAGVPVTFSGTGLKFSPVTVLTNESGEASTTVTAAGTGALTAEASVTGIATAAKFALTGTKAVLTFTAVNKSVPYDQNTTPYTDKVTGYENGDTSTAAYSGAPSETSTGTKGSPAGAYPIVIAVGTLKSTNYTFKFVNGTLTITSLGTTAIPLFSPGAGTYSAAQSVKITDTTAGSAIYYTTNGSTPTTSSTKYTAAITVSATETIKAIAVAAGYNNSAVASATYTIKAAADIPAVKHGPLGPATPTFSPAPGTYMTGQTVRLSDTTPGAVIYFTTNGTTPPAGSTRYTGPILVTATTTIKAIAAAPDLPDDSAVATGIYVVK